MADDYVNTQPPRRDVRDSVCGERRGSLADGSVGTVYRSLGAQGQRQSSPGDRALSPNAAVSHWRAGGDITNPFIRSCRGQDESPSPKAIGLAKSSRCVPTSRHRESAEEVTARRAPWCRSPFRTRCVDTVPEVAACARAADISTCERNAGTALTGRTGRRLMTTRSEAGAGQTSP